LSPNIVHVTPYYPPHLGGVERVAEALAVRSATRHDVVVLTSTSEEAVVEKHGRMTVHRLRAREFAHTPLPVLRLFTRLISLRANTVVHVHVAHAIWPDLVALAAMVRRFRVVAHFHLDVDPSGRAGVLLPAYKKHLLARSLRRANAVIALTETQATEIIVKYALNPSRVHVIGNGVDSAYVALPLRPRAADSPLRLLFVGRLEVQKNVPRLLRALQRVSAPVEVVIVGGGEKLLECQALVHELGLDNVQLVGPKFGDDLLDWYGWADAFAMTSDREGMPLALLEAMASGLAIIATDVSDLRAQVGPGGLVVPADDAAVAGAIEQLAGDTELLTRLQSASRERGRSFTWDPIAAEIEDVYESLRA
jgi:phosphatidylinositol alpha-mannosyltransferase